jgi:hypothetical protein
MQNPESLNPNARGDEREEVLETIIRHTLELSAQRQVTGSISPHAIAIRYLRHSAIRFGIVGDPEVVLRQATIAKLACGTRGGSR